MERDLSVCRAYRRRFVAIVATLSILGVCAPLLVWMRAASTPRVEDGADSLETWAIVLFAVACNLVVLSPLAGWYGARALVPRRRDAEPGVVITATKPTAAVLQMAIAAALLTIGWATPLVPSLWRFVNPGWWTWQDVLYILLVPVLSATTLVLFVRFCTVCKEESRSVAVLRWNPGDMPSEVSPYRFPIAPRQVLIVSEDAARTLRLQERRDGDRAITLAEDQGECGACAEEAWLVAPRQGVPRAVRLLDAAEAIPSSA